MPQQHGFFRPHKELQKLQTTFIIWVNFNLILILKQNALAKEQRLYPANFSTRCFVAESLRRYSSSPAQSHLQNCGLCAALKKNDAFTQSIFKRFTD